MVIAHEEIRYSNDLFDCEEIQCNVLHGFVVLFEWRVSLFHHAGHSKAI